MPARALSLPGGHSPYVEKGRSTSSERNQKTRGSFFVGWQPWPDLPLFLSLPDFGGQAKGSRAGLGWAGLRGTVHTASIHFEGNVSVSGT